MANYLLNNGEIIPTESFCIGASNRAFRFGDGLFETFRIANKTPLHIDEHLSRLYLGMQVLRMKVHPDLENKTFKIKIQNLLEINNLKNARMRLSVYRNDGGLYTPSDLSVSYILEAWNFNESLYTLNQTGLTLTYFAELQKPIHKIGSFKSLSTSLYTLAGIHAKDENCDDAILFNTNNEICEATSSNLFYLRNKTLYTPPLSSGCVAGVMRYKILEICKNNNIPCSQKNTTDDDLIKAEEVLLTNAARGIAWVLTYKNKNYNNTIAEFLIDKLNTTYLMT